MDILIPVSLAASQSPNTGTFINSLKAKSNFLSSLPAVREAETESNFHGSNGTKSAGQTVPFDGRVPCWKYDRIVRAVQRDGHERDVCL